MTAPRTPEAVPAGGAPYDVVVIGAGFAGLYAVHRAASEGLSVLGIEAAAGVGGTWYWNRYPGARCDVESVDYSYSFDPELQQSWTWSERFAAQPEILAYLEHVAERYDLLRHYRFERTVTGARFEAADSSWRVTTDDGEVHRGRHLICATGCLSAVNRPDIPGFDDFAGEVLYTAAWPQDPPELTGKRIGVIGTGSSGIQSVPLLAEQAAELTVFQRTANYSVPMPNRPLTMEDQQRIRIEYPARRAKSAYAPAGTPHETYPRPALEIDEEERRRALEARWAEGGVLFGKTFPDQNTDIRANDIAREFAEAKIRAIVKDPQVAEDLIPDDHPIGTKRICTDIGYFETFNRDHVRLVNLRRTPIERITPTGVTTTAEHHELDVLVLATGFDAMTGALTRIDPVGPRGDRLSELWADGPVTFLGMMVAGLPNLYSLSGPGSPSVLANMVLHAEVQVDWVIDLVLACRDRGVDEVEPRVDAADKWTTHLIEVGDATLFPRADSWYTGANVPNKKRVFMPYIGGFGNYRRRCDRVRDQGYDGLVLTTR